MTPAKPQDDYMHENTGEENFNESMYFNFYDRRARVGGFARIGNRPNERYAEVTLALYQADGTILFNYMRPAIADNSRFAAAGMSFRVAEPGKHLRVEYDGTAVFLARPLDLEHPKRAFTSNPRLPVKLALDYHGLSPIYGGESEAGISSSEMVFARGHCEQHVHAAGELTIDGRATAIDGFGLRDHSWGPRSWQSPRFYRWLTCEFDAGFGFMGSQIVTQSGSELRSGFVFRDGENHLVHDLALHSEWNGEGGHHSALRATLHSSAGDFEVTGRVLTMLPLRNRKDGKTTRISEGLTEWRCGEHVGYGWSEYLDQVGDASELPG